MRVRRGMYFSSDLENPGNLYCKICFAFFKISLLDSLAVLTSIFFWYVLLYPGWAFEVWPPSAWALANVTGQYGHLNLSPVGRTLQTALLFGFSIFLDFILILSSFFFWDSVFLSFTFKAGFFKMIASTCWSDSSITSWSNSKSAFGCSASASTSRSESDVQVVFWLWDSLLSCFTAF